MSSDTLRGIGQEGDGEGEAKTEDVARDANTAEPRGAEVESTGGQLRLSETLKDRFRDQAQEDIRVGPSVVSTVPGTHSLDSNATETVPSLDTKVSTFAATLLGVPAPIVDRERGTVQGRDVHLPVEARRSAGLRPVAKPIEESALAVPSPVEHSEPTQADPVVEAAVTRAQVSDGAPVDRDSHGPWYDQIPTADEVYDDPGPNILARVAIGAALAAMLSIFIFGFVRLRGRNVTMDEAPVSQVVPVRTAAEIPAPPKEPPVPTFGTPPAPVPLAAPVSPTPAAAPADIPTPSEQAVEPAREPPLPKRRVPTPRPSPVAPSNPAPDFRRAHAPSGETGADPAAALAVRPPVADAPVPPPTIKSPPVEKHKSKPVYDPDSTLPLNLE